MCVIFQCLSHLLLAASTSNMLSFTEDEYMENIGEVKIKFTKQESEEVSEPRECANQSDDHFGNSIDMVCCRNQFQSYNFYVLVFGDY